MEQFAKTNSAVDPSLDINISQVDLICVNQYIENKNYKNTNTFLNRLDRSSYAELITPGRPTFRKSY